jgi:hypothetical protein
VIASCRDRTHDATARPAAPDLSWLHTRFSKPAERNVTQPISGSIPSLSSAALAAYGLPPVSSGSSGPAEEALDAIGQSYGDDIAQLQSQLDPQQSSETPPDSLSSSLEALLAPESGATLSPDEQMLADAQSPSTYSSAARLVSYGQAAQPSLNLYG